MLMFIKYVFMSCVKWVYLEVTLESNVQVTFYSCITHNKCIIVLFIIIVFISVVLRREVCHAVKSLTLGRCFHLIIARVI